MNKIMIVTFLVIILVIVGVSLYLLITVMVNDLRKRLYNITSDEFEITEVLINGQFMPPGNFSEIVLPHAGMNCFAFQGTFNGKWTILYATGAVKIVAIPKSEFSNEKEEEKNGG